MGCTTRPTAPEPGVGFVHTLPNPPYAVGRGLWLTEGDKQLCCGRKTCGLSLSEPNALYAVRLLSFSPFPLPVATPTASLVRILSNKQF